LWKILSLKTRRRKAPPYHKPDRSIELATSIATRAEFGTGGQSTMLKLCSSRLQTEGVVVETVALIGLWGIASISSYAQNDS
jgi:hypothetical protein